MPFTTFVALLARLQMQKQTKMYLVLTNDQVPDMAYTTIKATCKAYALSYRSALGGKRTWLKGSAKMDLRELRVEQTTRKKC